MRFVRRNSLFTCARLSACTIRLVSARDPPLMHPAFSAIFSLLILCFSPDFLPFASLCAKNRTKVQKKSRYCKYFSHFFPIFLQMSYLPYKIRPGAMARMKRTCRFVRWAKIDCYSMFGLSGGSTAINNITVTEKATKMLRDGMLFNNRDNKTYNVMGADDNNEWAFNEKDFLLWTSFSLNFNPFSLMISLVHYFRKKVQSTNSSSYLCTGFRKAPKSIWSTIAVPFLNQSKVHRPFIEVLSDFCRGFTERYY